jgi:hypothetical protein
MRLRSTSSARLATAGLLTAGIWLAGSPGAVATSEQSLLSATTSARAHAGLAAYGERSDLAAVAQRWADWMAAHRTLAHNPALRGSVCCWTDLGENVGTGSSAGSVQRSFMASPPHRANILSSTFTQVGIGTARDADGHLYVDEVFRRPRTSRPAAASAAPAAPPRRAAPVRVSRGVHRSVLVAKRQPDLLEARIARARRHVRTAAAHADPVRRAVLYVVAMRAVSG